MSQSLEKALAALRSQIAEIYSPSPARALRDRRVQSGDNQDIQVRMDLGRDVVAYVSPSVDTAGYTLTNGFLTFNVTSDSAFVANVDPPNIGWTAALEVSYGSGWVEAVRVPVSPVYGGPGAYAANLMGAETLALGARVVLIGNSSAAAARVLRIDVEHMLVSGLKF